MRCVRNATCRRSSTPPEHSHHQPGSPGAQCVNCHMAIKDLHGRGRPARSQLPRAASGSVGPYRHSERMQQLSPRQAGDLGGGERGGVVSAGTPDHAALRDGAARRPQRCGRRGAAARPVDPRREPSPPSRGPAPCCVLARVATPASEVAIKAAIADPSPLVRAAAPRALPASLSGTIVEALAPLAG